MLSLDYRADLLIVDGADKINLTIETEFFVVSDGESVRCKPEDSNSLAPMLNFINKKVNALHAKRAGYVELLFDACGSIEVSPDPSHEAWQLGVSPGLLLVCPPDGDVVVFQK